LVQIPAKPRTFFLFHIILTGSGTHQPSSSMGKRGYLPGGKVAMGWGCWNIYISAEVKDE